MEVESMAVKRKIYTNGKYFKHELRIRNLEKDITDIKKMLNKVYLLGWGCFIAVLAMLAEIITR